MNDYSNAERLRFAVRHLKGRAVAMVRADEALGSSFTLHIGERRYWPRRPKLAALARGEFVLYVNCTWRLEERGSIVCTWADDRADEGPVMRGLQSLVGRTISGGHVSRRGWDLVLLFERGIRLVVFCDRSLHSDWVTCYQLRSPESIIRVEAGGTVVVGGARAVEEGPP